MKLIYVAGKYRDTTKADELLNIHRAALYAAYQWHEGNSVICPHLNTLKCWELNPATHDTYIAGDLKQVEVADEIHILPDWETSKGTKLERDLAMKLGKPIIYVSSLLMRMLQQGWERKRIEERKANAS